MRSIIHGTCLLKGKHPSGSKLARECPVLNAAKRAEARRGAWLSRKDQTGRDAQPGGSTGRPGDGGGS